MIGIQAVSSSTTAEKQAATAPIKPSLWLWVPWIWLFFASTRTPSTWMLWGNGISTVAEAAAGSPLDRLIMTTLMALGLIVLGIRWDQTKKLMANNKWVIGLFIYMALSIIWSNFPGITFRRVNRSIGTLEMVLVVLTERNVLESVRALLRRLYIIHIPLSVFAIKYMRNIGVVYNWNGTEEQWVGLTTDKNSLGQVVTCSGLFFVWQMLQDWTKRPKRNTKALLFYVPFLAATLWMLRGSRNIHSSTAIVIFLVCAAMLLSLQLLKKRSARAKRIIAGILFASSLLVPFAYLISVVFDVSPVDAVFHATGRDETFTDRTLIWTDVLNNAKKSPIIGVGMGAYWVGPIGYDLYPMPTWSTKTPSWRPEEGHNGFIDVYVELGAVGLIIMLVVICKGFLGSLNEIENNFQYGSLRLVFLFSIVLNNITETSFLKGTHDLWFLFLLTAINMPKPSATNTLKSATGFSEKWGSGEQTGLKGSAWRLASLIRSGKQMNDSPNIASAAATN